MSDSEIAPQIVRRHARTWQRGAARPERRSMSPAGCRGQFTKPNKITRLSPPAHTLAPSKPAIRRLDDHANSGCDAAMLGRFAGCHGCGVGRIAPISHGAVFRVREKLEGTGISIVAHHRLGYLLDTASCDVIRGKVSTFLAAHSAGSGVVDARFFNGEKIERWRPSRKPNS